MSVGVKVGHCTSGQGIHCLARLVHVDNVSIRVLILSSGNRIHYAHLSDAGIESRRSSNIADVPLPVWVGTPVAARGHHLASKKLPQFLFCGVHSLVVWQFLSLARESIDHGRLIDMPSPASVFDSQQAAPSGSQ